MTVAEMTSFIGKFGNYRVYGLTVNIEIIDVRERFGNLDFRIRPVSGTESIWVVGTSVNLG